MLRQKIPVEVAVVAAIGMAALYLLCIREHETQWQKKDSFTTSTLQFQATPESRPPVRKESQFPVSIPIPPNAELQQLDNKSLEDLYLSFVGSIQVRCKRQIHLGNIVDGGYDVCEDPDITLRVPCLAYSFGINRDFSFDDALSKVFGCDIHAFDPSNGMKDHNHSQKVIFHSKGLYDRNGVFFKNWNMRTFNTFRTELGHSQRRIDLVKIDIEGGEWVVLREMIDSRALEGVKQLLVEFHSDVHYGQVKVDRRTNEKYVESLGILRDLYQLGFRVFFFRRFHSRSCMFKSSHDGREKTGCYEVHFLNIFASKQLSSAP